MPWNVIPGKNGTTLRSNARKWHNPSGRSPVSILDPHLSTHGLESPLSSTDQKAMWVRRLFLFMSAPPSNSPERSVKPTQLAASAGLGVIAAVLGYLLSFLLVAGEARETALAAVPDWKIGAWYFYNGHLVDVEATGSIGDFGGTETIDFIAQSTAASAGALYFVPPLVLLGVGGLLAVRLDAGDVGEAVLAGAPVAIGYVVVMAAGVLVTEASTEATFLGVDVSGSIAPALLPAILLAGLVYPIVFATFGAILVVLIRTD